MGSKGTTCNTLRTIAFMMLFVAWGVVWNAGTAEAICVAINSPLLSDPLSAVETPLQDQASTESLDIPGLIAQLESRTFAERELATEKLIQAGSVALRPLAQNLDSASTETVYRTRKIVEKIALAGDESTFLKAAGILKIVMFRSLEGNHALMKQLESDWKSGRTQIAANRLREAGANVVLESDPPVENGFNPLRVQTIYPSPPVNPAPEPQRPKKLTRKETRRTIDQILVGSIDQNRELVFGETETATDESGASMAVQMVREQQRRMARNAFLNNVPVIGPDNSITLGTDWKGSDKLFEEINSIENLTRIRLESFHLTEQRLKILARIATLNRLEIKNCQMDEEQLKQLAELSQIVHLGIIEQPNAEQILDVARSLPNLNAIEVSDCHFDGDQLQKICRCRRLVQIYLTGMPVPEEALQQMGELRRLRYLNLKSCSFDLDAFSALKQKRPNLNITTVARAFLGVRGPIAFSGDSDTKCQITEVIPGSGADQAGVLVDDVITELNGHPISNFNDLVLYISQHDIGDSLEISVIREGKPMKLSAELGERDESVQ